MRANRDTSHGSSGPRDAHKSGQALDAGANTGATRSHSGPKFNATYAQQLKKQVQASSQANNIDPLSTKQYLQNYLSEHPTTSGAQASAQGTKQSAPLKVLKNTQVPGQANDQHSSSHFKQNYASLSSSGNAGIIQKDATRQGHSNRNGLKMNSQGSQNGPSTSQQVSHATQSMGELASYDRRKDRVSSSSKTKLTDQNQTSNVSRSLVRPSSKNRVASQQPTGSNSNMQTQKIYPNGAGSSSAQKSHSQQARGSSPKVPPANGSQPSASRSQGTLKGGGANAQAQAQSVQQLNMSGQNLQNYFDNQIPQFQAASSKNLPRKKRITVQQQAQQQSASMQNMVKHSEPSESHQPVRQASRGSKALPPMGQQATGGGVRNPSPSSNAQAQGRAPNHDPSSQSTGAAGTEKRPNSRQNRPQAANSKPKPFQKEELFLNVDSQYNDLIMQMIQPNRSHFDFEGSVQYVMNASELSNQALAKLLYNRKNIPLPKVPESLQQTFKQQPVASRSRNIAGVSSMGKNGAAGQSTASFFNTKKSFQAATFQQAASGLLDNAIRRAEGYHDGPDSTAQIGKDFYQSVRQEIRGGTPEQTKQLMPDYQPAKFSAKRNGIVAAYGANTNQGIVRNYNEDRVAIILNIMKPKSKQFSGAEWPKCSFFGIYDGHGGHVCADFLRDYLHQFIIKDQFFPQEPVKAIKNGFKEAEKLFLEFAEGQQFEVGDIDRSGSCAIVALIIDDMCYIGNTGDSRACMSADGGRQVVGLSTDHKPTDDIEMHRILNNKGRIYQNASIVNVQQPGSGLQSQIVLGPHRVFPGRLSVCRTFGDIEAKLDKLDGNSCVVIADPDVSAFRIERDKHDFIVIGCDGIFDKLENRDCVHLVWQACLMEDIGQDSLVNPTDEESMGNQKQPKTQDERRHKLAGLAVDSILKTCAMRRSCDNITSVVIAFDNFYRKLDEGRKGAAPKIGKVLTSLDHEVFEEIQMQPVSDSEAASTADRNGVIYIESDEHHESQNESQNLEGADEQARNISEAPNRQLVGKSTDSGSLLFGETGTTSQNSGAAQQQLQQQQNAAMHMQQNSLTQAMVGVPPTGDLPNGGGVLVKGGGQVAGAQVGANPYGGALGQADKILSEIAEEDSISMISDKPRRFKPSDCVTPADPVTNSFMGSIRESQTNVTHQRLRENTGKENGPVGAQGPVSLSSKHTPSMTGGKASALVQSSTVASVNPYTQPQKHPAIGAGSSAIQHKPQIASSATQIISGQTQIITNEQIADKGKPVSQTEVKMNRPSSSSQRRSGSGQGSRSVLKKTNNLQQMIESNQNTSLRSRQSRPGAVTKNYTYDQASNSHGHQLNGAPSSSSVYGHVLGQGVANAYSQSSSQQMPALGQGGGNLSSGASSHNSSILVGNNNASSTSGTTGQIPTSTSSGVLPAATNQSLYSVGGGPQGNSSTYTSSTHTGSHLHMHGGVNSQPGSQSHQIMPSLNSMGSDGPSQAAALYQVKPSSKGRRSSNNQSHQRGNYSQNSQSIPNPALATQASSSQPPSHSKNLLPVTQATSQAPTALQLANQKVGSQGRQSQVKNAHSADAVGLSSNAQGKKSRTQQPNKLVEIFRQVDGQQNQVLNTTGPQTGLVGPPSSNQFVPKGSLSSNNQMLMRSMQMQNPMNAGGAQVHNIQIKPISANKMRRSGASGNGGPHTLIQAQFHGSKTATAGAGQGIVQSRGGAGSSSKDKTGGFPGQVLNQNQSHSHETVGATGKSSHAKQPSNKLISQYLAQVNQSSSSGTGGGKQSGAAGSSQTYGGGVYASRSTRGNTEKSPGVLSRAQRVQMTYNQSLPQSKTSLTQIQGNSASNSSLTAQATRQTSAGGFTGGAGGKNSTVSLATSAYAQSLLPSGGAGGSGLGAKKGETKSRNSQSHTGTNGGSQGGGGGSHSLPKWQSLNMHPGHQPPSGTGPLQNSAAGLNHTYSYEVVGGVQGSGNNVKKRKSNNL